MRALVVASRRGMANQVSFVAKAAEVARHCQQFQVHRLGLLLVFGVVQLAAWDVATFHGMGSMARLVLLVLHSPRLAQSA